jgi:hypothetical protein
MCCEREGKGGEMLEGVGSWSWEREGKKGVGKEYIYSKESYLKVFQRKLSLFLFFLFHGACGLSGTPVTASRDIRACVSNMYAPKRSGTHHWENEGAILESTCKA